MSMPFLTLPYALNDSDFCVWNKPGSPFKVNGGLSNKCGSFSPTCSLLWQHKCVGKLDTLLNIYQQTYIHHVLSTWFKRLLNFNTLYKNMCYLNNQRTIVNLTYLFVHHTPLNFKWLSTIYHVPPLPKLVQHVAFLFLINRHGWQRSIQIYFFFSQKTEGKWV